jgi:serine protease SohB
LQAQIHDAFIAQVRQRRGAKLKGEDLFSGEFWLGARAVELGLADALGHMVPAMKARYGDKVRFAVHGPRRPLIPRFGLGLAQDALDLVEERAHWARFGL